MSAHTISCKLLISPPDVFIYQIWNVEIENQSDYNLAYSFYAPNYKLVLSTLLILFFKSTDTKCYSIYVSSIHP